MQHLFDAGFQSSHRHGRGIDFSYPMRGGKRVSFSELKDLFTDEHTGAFPGTKIIEEGNHLHMQPSDETKSRISDAQALGAYAITRTSWNQGNGGASGGGMATVVDSSTNVHNSTVLAIGNGPHAPSIDDGINI